MLRSGSASRSCRSSVRCRSSLRSPFARVPPHFCDARSLFMSFILPFYRQLCSMLCSFLLVFVWVMFSVTFRSSFHSCLRPSLSRSPFARVHGPNTSEFSAPFRSSFRSCSLGPSPRSLLDLSFACVFAHLVYIGFAACLPDMVAMFLQFNYFPKPWDTMRKAGAYCQLTPRPLLQFSVLFSAHMC